MILNENYEDILLFVHYYSAKNKSIQSLTTTETLKNTLSK